MAPPDLDAIKAFAALSAADRRAIEARLSPVEQLYIRACIDKARAQKTSWFAHSADPGAAFRGAHSRRFLRFLDAAIAGSTPRGGRPASVTPAMRAALKQLRDRKAAKAAPQAASRRKRARSSRPASFATLLSKGAAR